MRFTWDERKARANLAKHRVSFQEAQTIFYDPFHVAGLDPDYPSSEVRWITFGVSSAGRVLVVVCTEDSDTIRIISARTATRGERTLYEKG